MYIYMHTYILLACLQTLTLNITLCHLALSLDLYLWQQEVQQDLRELLDLDLCQQEVQEHQDLSLHLFLQVAQQDQQELEVQQELETDVLCALSNLPGSCSKQPGGSPLHGIHHSSAGPWPLPFWSYDLQETHCRMLPLLAQHHPGCRCAHQEHQVPRCI